MIGCLLVPARNLSAQALALPGMQTGPAPWTEGHTGLTARLKAIGLPAMPAEAFASRPPSTGLRWDNSSMSGACD
ncbi:MAG: hypothetical protein EXR93_08025 [Gemmatimonadetes bacterium]|nr:hypothetical protein [Gemmatimonadota bacterium]